MVLICCNQQQTKTANRGSDFLFKGWKTSE